jgi:ribosomal protein S18 acetylase RimI-like enzyme
MHTIESTSSPALRSAMDANMVAFWSAYGRGEGCTLQQRGDAVWFYTGVPHPLFNGVPRAVLAADDVQSTIDALQARIDADGAPAFWWLGPSTTPDDLATTLARRGLEPAGEVPGMVLNLHSIDSRLPEIAGFSVAQIGNQSQRALWARLAAIGTGAPATVVDALERVEATLDDPAYRAQHRFIGYLDGQPVATAALVLDSGVAGVYAIATIPEARRRGIGRYMTLLPLLQARQLGYIVAILQSSSAGYSLYKALGFNDVCRYRLYMQTRR